MSIDASEEAALQIARFVAVQLDDSRSVTDFVGSRPVRLTEALDSLGLLELATFVEDTFGVQIQDDEIVPENFATVADVVRVLRDKGALTAPSAADDDDRKSARP
jgi:acyl carrier protein